MKQLAFKALSGFGSYLTARRIRRFFWALFYLAVLFGMISGIGSCAVKNTKLSKAGDYVASLNPEKLREAVNLRRVSWIATCINNGAAGVLGGATMGAEAITACTDAGFRLYPEQDWNALAKANQSDFTEKYFLDMKEQ